MLPRVCEHGAASASGVPHTSCFLSSTMCGIHAPERPVQVSPVFCTPHWHRGSAMTFEEILDQAIAMLQRRGRLTYGALKRQFQLDDAYLEDLKAELIEGQRLAVDEDDRVLVWTGAAVPPPASAPTPP